MYLSIPNCSYVNRVWHFHWNVHGDAYLYFLLFDIPSGFFDEEVTNNTAGKAAQG